MKNIRAAVVGYGNIGRKVVEALEAAPDFEVAGIVRRSVPVVAPAGITGYKVVDDIAKLCSPASADSGERAVDVAIICSPSRKVEETAARILALGINTVDSFDIHSEIVGLRARLGEIARKAGSVAIVSAGWDPGTDSVVRTLLEACAPTGVTHTNFGPGMSMGHTVAAKTINGVRNALSMTIPMGGGVHRREVYIETEPGTDFETTAAAIKSDPYFAKDETRVTQVTDVAALVNTGHGVQLAREGGSGCTDGQKFDFSMRIDNPALTGQILVSAARAAVRTQANGQPGAYTMIEIPLIDLLPGERTEIIKRLV